MSEKFADLASSARNAANKGRFSGKGAENMQWKILLVVFAVAAISLGAMADASHDKVQLWSGGPYWATTNIGANEPWESGYYFWWGDTVGYRRENDAWVAIDGSSSNFQFDYNSISTCNKSLSTLKNEGWITEDGVLAPAHDAAHVQRVGRWRMPTYKELNDLNSKCNWTWTTTNSISGYLVSGKGEYASNSIFLPAAGAATGDSLVDVGSYCYYWSSVPDTYGSANAGFLVSYRTDDHGSMMYSIRSIGRPIRSVQGYVKPIELSTLTANYTAQDGDVLTGETIYTVTIPSDAIVTINGVEVVGGSNGGSAVPVPEFPQDGASEVVKFAQAQGGTWTITAFAELGNASIGDEVSSNQVKVYAADTLEGLKTADQLTEGITIENKSAVKSTIQVVAPSNKDGQFFQVKFGK